MRVVRGVHVAGQVKNGVPIGRVVTGEVGITLKSATPRACVEYVRSRATRSETSPRRRKRAGASRAFASELERIYEVRDTARGQLRKTEEGGGIYTQGERRFPVDGL